MPTFIDIRGVTWKPDEAHKAICRALSIDSGRGSKAAVAARLGINRQTYNRGWFTGPTSLSKVALWANAAGLVLEVRDGVAQVAPE